MLLIEPSPKSYIERSRFEPQVALAWLLGQKPWVFPIPGTTTLHRLEENIGAADVEITAEDHSEIGAAAAELSVTGAWLPEPALRMTGV